eukprot:4364113-Pleurochrysis_carterae.AAC.9
MDDLGARAHARGLSRRAHGTRRGRLVRDAFATASAVVAKSFLAQVGLSFQLSCISSVPAILANDKHIPYCGREL